MSKGKVLVIGGGPCGCGAAWEIIKAGYEVILIEAQEKLGGLASHQIYNGNIFEYGTHVFHTDQERLLTRVKSLMGEELLEIERGSNIHIKFEGKYFIYPLQGWNLLSNLSSGMTIKAVVSFMNSFLLHDSLFRRTPHNTEEYLIQKFGKVLYDLFFKDYSEKVWGIPCTQLDAFFGAQRIPRSDIFSILKKLLNNMGLARLIDSHPLSEQVIGNIYYTEKGIGKLFERIGAEVESSGGKILTGTKLKKIIVENGRVRAAIVKRDTDEIEIECDFYISTIPLPVLAECFSESAPADVLEAGRNLHYRAISLIGMLVAKCQVRPAYFTYFPKLSFNRLSEPINHGLKVKQEGHTLLIAETVCAHGDSAWKGEKAFCQAVVDDIVSESLLRKEDIAEIHPYAWRYAYPIYTIGFRRNVDKVLSFLQSLHNIHSTGRHGEFNYVNMHVAMQMGIASLDKVKAYAGDTIKKCTAK